MRGAKKVVRRPRSRPRVRTVKGTPALQDAIREAKALRLEIDHAIAESTRLLAQATVALDRLAKLR